MGLKAYFFIIITEFIAVVIISHASNYLYFTFPTHHTKMRHHISLLKKYKSEFKNKSNSLLNKIAVSSFDIYKELVLNLLHDQEKNMI